MKSQRGFTIFELMLVFAIVAAVLIIGIQQYIRYQREQQITEVKTNVDRIFQALAYYYQANCSQVVGQPSFTPPSDPTHTRSGTLDPNDTSLPNPFPIDIQTDLAANNYLTDWPFFDNPIVSHINYIAQLNRLTPNPTRDIMATQGTSTTPTSVSLGNIIVWKLQVAILPRDVTLANVTLLQGLLGADCTSELEPDGVTVYPCTNPPTHPGSYLVWERLPSYATSDSTTDLWPSLPIVKQFTQMYTTYPTTTLTSGFQPITQNYQCGE